MSILWQLASDLIHFEMTRFCYFEQTTVKEFKSSMKSSKNDSIELDGIFW